jgi:hypothetical protein
MSKFIIGSIVVCKKGYSYNGTFNKGDKFIIISYSDYNIRLKTKLNTFHNICYYKRPRPTERYYYDLFYKTGELRKIKINKLNKKICLQ